MHPALGPGLSWGSDPSAAGISRSPLNLRGEEEILRFGLGLFSSLAFLEAEGWPLRPGPRDWVLTPDGLPLFRAATSPLPDDPLLAGYAALLFRLLSGRHSPVQGPWPSIPRRHRRFAAWNGWLTSTLAGNGEEIAPFRSRLLGLWSLAGDGPPPGLSPGWGLGFRWVPPAEFSSPGVHAVRTATHSALLEAVFGLALSGDRGGLALDPVPLGHPPPYPFAALEPLVRQVLGGEHEAEAWMREGLIGEAGQFAGRLAPLLARPPRGVGWLLWPGEALDHDSRAVLDQAAESASVPLVILHETQGGPGGQINSPRLLWFSETAEGWYLDHARALLGEDPEFLLTALSRYHDDHPRCGDSLLPPTPVPMPPPARSVLGSGGPQAIPPAAPASESARLAAEGHLASLLHGAREAHPKDAEAGQYWEGVVLLQVGQPLLAMRMWEGLSEESRWSHGLAFQRIKALERLQDYRAADRQADEALSRSIPAAERDAIHLLKGQFHWLLGRFSEAESCLEGVATTTNDPDLRVQALCHWATAALHDDRPEQALALLERAGSATPQTAQPITRFLLTHRRAMVHQKLGEHAAALSGFEEARSLASSFGFRSLESGCECDCANVLRRLLRFDDASRRLRRGLEGAIALGLPTLEEVARTNLAACTAEAGNLLPALRQFENSAARKGSPQNPQYLAVDCFWLGSIHQQLGDYPTALEWTERGLSSLPGTDPEVRLPLQYLRGELLLQTRQIQKLRRLVKEISNQVHPDVDADDRLAISALRCAAARRGAGSFSAEDHHEAVGLLGQATPYFRAFWHLLAAGEAGEIAETTLLRAWAEAGHARSPYLAARALWELACLGALPPLSPEDRQWIRDFLVKNRVRGPERGLLGFLTEAPPPSGPATRAEASPVAFLAAAESAPEETMAGILERTGSAAGCLLRPGSAPHWWGEGSEEQRRSLIQAAGSRGEKVVAGGSVLGLVTESGLWCGLFKAGPSSFDAEQIRLAAIWIRLLPAAPVRTPPPPGRDIHPAIGRHLLSASSAMRAVIEAIQRASVFRFPVLFTGEPGVGKEVCAKALHAASPRAPKNWVAANCANLTPTLAASLLFGHRRGAFTGADRDQTGLVEAARGSTLFLDEVGELPQEVQAHLLRFLQDGTFLPLGEVRGRESDARIVAATNRDLERAASEGLFRQDLLHRLRVIEIEVPPLRRRPEDIPLLFAHFLEEAAAAEGFPCPRVTPPVLMRLGTYPWPGNVRELQNAARAMLVASAGAPELREEHLPRRLKEGPRDGPGGRSLPAILEEAEHKAIAQAIQESGGNLSAAARSLAISRQSLLQKMKRLGLSRS